VPILLTCGLQASRGRRAKATLLLIPDHTCKLWRASEHCKVCCSTAKYVHHMVLRYHKGNPHAQWHAWEGSTLVPLPLDEICHKATSQIYANRKEIN
jgi:hypothetical protein